MNPKARQEWATGTSLPLLGGVELLRACYVRQNFSRHVHEGYALGVIESGALAFRYRGEGLVAAAGEINLVVPGEAHDGHAALPGGWAYRMFYLPPEALARAAAELSPGPGLPHFAPGVLTDPELAADVAAVHRLALDPETPLLARETRLLGLLTAWIARHAASRPGPRRLGAEHAAVAAARDYLRDHLEEDVGLEELARACGLSPWHLVRVFARDTGLPPHAWLVQARLERARTLLAGPSRLADIAAETGFADQAHLTREFKRRHGLTPGAYRKIVQNRRT